MPDPRAGLAGAGIALIVAATLPAEAATVAASGYTLTFDDTVWQPMVAVPPAEVALACVAPPQCGDGSLLTAVRDGRPLPSPGAGRFTPGAVSAAALTLRAQALTPGARLVADEPARPLQTGGRRWMFGSYRMEDRDLGERRLLVALTALPPGTLVLRLTAPAIPPASRAAFLAVLESVGSH